MHTSVTGSPHDPLDELRPLPGPKWEESGSFTDIRYEVAEGIAKLTICRPERRNAFRPQTLFELTEAFTLARDNPDVGVIILCGEGPDAFCSGGDQKIRGDDGYMGDDSVAQRGIGRLNVLDLQIQMRRTPKPIVAMIAGYAVGGGHVLHLVCDLSIAADNARFGQTGPKVGSFDGGYGSSLLARTIGPKRAKEVWFLCRQYDAAQALEWGLVNTVVPLADLEKETIAWCRQILSLSPIALRMIKASMNAADDGLAGVQQLAGDATMLFYMTEEGQEGRNAFVEHRNPDFSEETSASPVTTPLKLWVAGARPRTLPAALVPVVVGTTAGYLTTGRDFVVTSIRNGHVVGRSSTPITHSFSFVNAILALVVALALQIGTNYVNDYADGVRGTDEVRVGPVRLVAGKLASVRQVKLAALTSFGVAGIAGLVLAIRVSYWFIPLGLLCGLAGWAYTGGRHPYGYLGLGEVLVFVFFGLVATAGSAYVQHVPLTHGYSFPWAFALWAGVPVGLLAAALLQANNLRDVGTDEETGKKTMAVRLGRRHAGYLYVVTVAAAAASIGVLQHYRGWALLALVALPLGVVPARLAVSGKNGRELLPMLSTTARLQLAVGVLLAAGLLLVRP